MGRTEPKTMSDEGHQRYHIGRIEPPAPGWRITAWRRLVALGCWLYAAGLLVLPLGLLVPAAALARRRWLAAPLGIALILFIGPILGFELPWATLVSGGPPGLRVRVLTCNVD